MLLSDVVMPEMNGIELAAAARKLRPGVETILLSGFTPGTLTRHSLTDEAAPAILQKPLSRDELVGVVSAAVARARG